MDPMGSEFSHEKWWIFPSFFVNVYQAGYDPNSEILPFSAVRVAQLKVMAVPLKSSASSS